mgnify:CR=1 FL=1
MHTTLRRPTRPSDRRMGLVYGEDPRPVQYTTGLHAGHTVVQVRGPQAVAQLVGDGWVVLWPQAPAPLPARSVAPAPVTPPAPAAKAAPAAPAPDEAVSPGKRGSKPPQG